MRAIQLLASGDVAMTETARRDPGPGEVELRVTASALGLTQARLVRGQTRPNGPRPIVPGHEIVGRVERTGDGVRTFAVGDRVLVSPVQTCAACEWCMSGTENLCIDRTFVGVDFDGGWSEYVTVPASLLFGVPEEVPDEDAVLITSAMATAMHACSRASIPPGGTVVVMGAGSIGLLACQIARSSGAGTVVVVDRDPERLELASPYADTRITSGSDVAELVADIRANCPGGTGGDVVFEAVGVPTTVSAAIQAVRPRGQVVLIGILTGDPTITVDDYHYGLLAREATLIPSFSYGRRAIVDSLKLHRLGRIDLSPIRAGLIELVDVPDELKRMLAGEGPVGGRYVVRIGDVTSS